MQRALWWLIRGRTTALFSFSFCRLISQRLGIDIYKLWWYNNINKLCNMNKVQLINVNSKMRKNLFYFLTKKGRTFPLVKISFFERYWFIGFIVFYAAMSHLAELYCLICSWGAMILNGLLSLSIANIILHTLCETAPIATSFGFESHFWGSTHEELDF